MSNPVGIMIPRSVAKRLQRKADKEQISAEELVSWYIEYSLIHHKDVARFEKQYRTEEPEDGTVVASLLKKIGLKK